MKAILMSIHPKWCEKIFNGEKTIEVRKSRPSIPTPFTVLVYMTKRKWIFKLLPFLKNRFAKVIGEFVCDRITNIHCYSDTKDTSIYEPSTCLTGEEICEYLNYEDGYGWHISDLKIYDKPRELGEFRKPCNHINDCCTCKEAEFQYDGDELRGLFCRREIPLIRPPQSYYFVETNEN